jgi:hypothetical protein
MDRHAMHVKVHHDASAALLYTLLRILGKPSTSKVVAKLQGFVSKEVIRAQYDGSLFYQLARKQDARIEARSKKTKRT